MTFDRPYSVAISFEAAAREIERCSGTHFDPAVVETFLKLPLELLETIRNGSGLDADPCRRSRSPGSTRQRATQGP